MAVPVGFDEASSAPGRPLRVMVVDDDDASRELLEEAVNSVGYDCISARDGVEAAELHRATPVDVILSDWVMPRMTGLDLCRRVREQPGDYTYFIFMTALADKAHLLEGMRAGADDYLRKPIDLEELEARLMSASRVIKLQRTLAEHNANLRHASETQFRAARIDALTDVANRLRLKEDLEALRSRASRYGHRYCAALLDIDLFKQFNDHFGHIAGDEALRRVAQTVRDALRTGDTLYRYGGEEFLVILPEQLLSEAARAMERVRAAVQRLAVPHVASAPAGVLTISVGIAELGPTETHDQWLRRADAALYRAKAHGRNRVELDDPHTAAA